jgi:capsular exopolysaccharide synthesis family protein
LEVHYYWKVIVKRLWIITLLCIVGVGTSLWYSLSQPPLYRTSTTLLLSPPPPDRLIPRASKWLEEMASTYVEYMKTSAFANLVIKKTGLEISPDEFASSISAELIPGTLFFKISATNPSPEKAQLLANTMAEVIIAEHLAHQKAQQELQKEAMSDSVVALLNEKLEMERQYYERKVASLRQQIEELESQPQSDEREEELMKLHEELIRVEGLLIQVMTNLTDLQQGQSSGVSTAIVVEPATLPTKPLRGKTAKILLFAFSTSLSLGVGLAFLLEYLDYTFKTPEELEAAFGMPTLGAIGIIANEREKIVALSDPKSSIAEAFRSLRTNVHLACLDKPMKTLLITSAAPLEGKTLIAANLAVTMAKAGKKVILVDGDLKKPSLHKLFGLSNYLGLTNLLIYEHFNRNSLENFLQKTDVEGLSILSSGPLPPDPSYILCSERMEKLIEDLKETFDVVIFDSSPTVAITDGLILATKVDASIQVVLAGMTRRDIVVKGRDLLTKVGANLLGPVLNKVKPSNLGYYRYRRRR